MSILKVIEKITIGATESSIDDQGRANIPDVFLRSTGDQTVSGVKTFNASPSIPTPTSDSHPATKEYVDRRNFDNLSNTSLVNNEDEIRLFQNGEEKKVSKIILLDEVINGKTSDIPANIPFELTGYWRPSGGAFATPAYGHNATQKTLLRAGQVLEYGVNIGAADGASVLQEYNLDGTNKRNVKKPDPTINSSFFTGTHTSPVDVLIALSNYQQGGYGVAYARKTSQSQNYKGLIGVTQDIDNHEVRIENLENQTGDSIQSDEEALRMYNMGRAEKTYTSKKFGIIVAGQSNTEGRVPLASDPPSWYVSDGSPSALTNVKRWNNGPKNWDNLPAPALWAYDFHVLHELANYLSDNVYVIKRAKGGTAISTKGIDGGGFWDPYFENVTTGLVLTKEFERYIREAMKSADFSNIEIKAFLWHQGESDSTTLAAEEYYRNLKNLISYIRGVVGNPKLPVIFGTISHSSAQYNATVEAAQIKIANEDEYTYCIDMSAGTLLDSWHFDGQSSEYLGNKMFDIIKDF